MSAPHGVPEFDPVEWDVKPDTDGKQFAVEFDVHGPFVWIGSATNSRDAIHKARAELSRKNPAFDTKAAHLVSLQEMHR